MNIEFRLSEKLYKAIHSDLHRKHAYAAERVGFIKCALSKLNENDLLVLANSYMSLDDEDYVYNPNAGATMGTGAIRKALQTAYNERCAMFHVHRHDHFGIPRFSRTDLVEGHKFVPDFFKVQPNSCHGIIVLSFDSASGLCWLPNNASPTPLNAVSVNGRLINARRTI